MNFAFIVALGLIAGGAASPVQKVIELLEENKVKVSNDLAAEEKEMAEYSDFCDKEASEKGYAIKTATSKLEDLSATIEECELKIPGHEDEVSTLGSQVAGKEKELGEARDIRDKERADFGAAEKDLATSIDQLGRAAQIIGKATSGGAFMQESAGAEKQVTLALKVINKIIDANRISTEGGAKLESLMQTGNFAADDEEQPQAKEVGYESKSGGIVGKIEEMKEKAEEELTSMRNAEMKKSQDFQMLELSLNNGIKVAKDKISVGKKEIGAKNEELNTAKGDKQETLKVKATDEEYLGTLKHECEETAAGWEERQSSAKAEMGAINKAIEILSDGVRVLLQVAQKTRRTSGHLEDAERAFDGDESSDESADQVSTSESQVRPALIQKLKNLSHKFGSYALMEMAGAAAMDPFAKIRGLIEDMIEKLLKEAQEEATQKAFCDEEMGKSKKALAKKGMTIEKLQARLDKAGSRKAELTEAVKTLEAETADLDSATAEATKIRNAEHATYVKSSTDFKDAAAAVEGAMKVLKDFYDGQSFLQVSSKTRTMTAAKAEDTESEDDEDGAPAFGGAKGDAAHAILSILEMSLEDFTKMVMEIETGEQEAVEAFEKLSTESKISKAAKAAEVKASLMEVKSLDVSLNDSQEDRDSTSKELDAVTAYIDELKPQCETKVMSYAEKKARRKAEIEGLKEALSILSGEGLALVQTARHVQRV